MFRIHGMRQGSQAADGRRAELFPFKDGLLALFIHIAALNGLIREKFQAFFPRFKILIKEEGITMEKAPHQIITADFILTMEDDALDFFDIFFFAACG